ncbi:MAG TPA: VOC family protein, partial [Acidobacteriota bacterium]
GHKKYLEIIAPDPNQSEFKFHLDMRKFTEPRLITWGAATNDIELIAKKAKAESFELIGPRDGSRTRPDGKILKWKTLVIEKTFGDDQIEPLPFFIQWSADSLHPSEDSPKGCELVSFEIEHPKAGELTEAFKKLGIDIKVKEAKSIRIIANLKTPKGSITLS